jgi:hypothetical protein
MYSSIFGLAQNIWTGTKHFVTCKRTRHYRSQNVLGWSKCFVPDQKFIYIFELFIPFSFFILAYEVTKILRNSLFTFLLFFILLNFCLACLALQNAKTEHMEMKILQPIFGILVALTKKELTKICNEPGNCGSHKHFVPDKKMICIQ